jgi:nicotinic acid phosphoribosyltransferase
LLEAGLLQAIGLSTLIATKASRIVYAAEQGHPRRVAEFAFRRAQEPMTVARASYICGCSSTSLLNAAYEYRLPASLSLNAGAAIDAFGIGTSLGSGAGSVERNIEGGSLGIVYKEVWYVDGSGNEYPKMKVAGGAKSTWPGKKEIYRHPNWEEDVIQLAHEPRPDSYHRLFLLFKNKCRGYRLSTLLMIVLRDLCLILDGL